MWLAESIFPQPFYKPGFTLSLRQVVGMFFPPGRQEFTEFKNGLENNSGRWSMHAGVFAIFYICKLSLCLQTKRV